VALASVWAAAGVPHANAATFNPNRIIDDSIFDNYQAMAPSQIDSWLNQFPYSCISPNSGFKTIDPVGYSQTTGFRYGNWVTAGQAISDAANAYSINPQVILATLQKEQSLVIGGSTYCNDGNEHKYAAAVGYGCPDGGTVYAYSGINLYMRNGVAHTSVPHTCVNSAPKAGFSQQIIRAAWLLKFSEERSEGKTDWAVVKPNWDNSDDLQSCYSGPMTQGTFARCPSGGAAFYDGYTTIDSTAVHMDTGATAALYWYTPHFHGNQNFFDLFTSWFGPTQGTILLQSPESPAVYLLSGNNRYGVPSYDMLRAYGFDTIKITPVTDEYMNSLTDGGTLGTTFTQNGGGAVYLVDNGYRFGFSTYQQCVDWGKPTCISAAKPLADSVFNRLLNAGDIKSLMLNGSTVYLMQGGQRRAFLTGKAMTENGYSSANITPITNVLNYSVPDGFAIPENNSFVKFTARPYIYLYKDSKFYQLATYNALLGWLPQGTPVYNDSHSLYNTQAPTVQAMLDQFVFSSDGHKYILSDGKRYDITAVSSDWPTQADATAFTTNLALLPVAATVNQSSVLRLPSGFMFRVENKLIRPLNSLYDFFAAGYTDTNVVNIPATATAILGTGATVFADGGGSLFKTTDTGGAIYIANSGATACKLASLSQLGQFKFTAQTPILSTASFGQFTGGSDLNSLITDASGNTFVVNGGKKYMISSVSLRSDWGVSKSDLCGFSTYFLGRLPTPSQTVAHFGRAPSGVIYYASGGTKHPLSWQKFLALGGNSSNTIDLPNDFLELSPTGSPMN
jgi:hypothetical protein